MNNSNRRWTELSTMSLPVVIVVVTIFDLVMYQRSPSELIFDPPLLVIMLTTVFVSGMAFAVTYVSARTYMTTGSLKLLLGTGMLALATGCLGVWLRRFPSGVNLLVTTHNIGMLLGSALCFASMTSPVVKQLDASKLKLSLTAGYFSVLGFMGVVMVLAIKGAFPPFFIEGTGHTFPSQSTLVISAILFAVSSNITMRTYLRSKKRSMYWYSLALGSFAFGDFIFLFARFVGDPLGWGEGLHNALEVSTFLSRSYQLGENLIWKDYHFTLHGKLTS